MASMFKTLWDRLSGTRHGGGGAEPVWQAVEYKGYRIRPTPFPAQSQYQTAGVIEKDFDTGTKQHRFIRAEAHTSKEEAAAFAISKGKQIIDEQGDRLFGA